MKTSQPCCCQPTIVWHQLVGWSTHIRMLSRIAVLTRERQQPPRSDTMRESVIISHSTSWSSWTDYETGLCQTEACALGKPPFDEERLRKHTRSHAHTQTETRRCTQVQTTAEDWMKPNVLWLLRMWLMRADDRNMVLLISPKAGCGTCQSLSFSGGNNPAIDLKC